MKPKRLPDALLQQARDMLVNADDLDSWARACALLGRQALEGLIASAIEREYGAINRPSFSSQLIVLRSIVDPHVAHDAAWAWEALSSAIHVHGYSLPPTGGQLRRWLEAVERLRDAL